MGITVVLPVYNAEAFLDEALASVYAQSLQPDEIVAVNDGSTDGSVAVLRRHPRVRVVDQTNAGCASARNRGIALATMDSIVFLDADDVWHPERLARAQAMLTGDGAPDFVACALRNFLTPGLDAAPAWLTPAMLEHPQAGFATNALMVQRAALQRVGPFDAQLRNFSDSEWLVRALDAGLTYAHIDEPLVRRRIHAHNITGAVHGTAAHRATMARILHASLKRRRSGANQP